MVDCKRSVSSRHLARLVGGLLVLSAPLYGAISAPADRPTASDIEAEVADAHTVILNDIAQAPDSPGVEPDLAEWVDVRKGAMTDTVRFLSDVDSDGDLDLVTYYVSDGYLLRNVQHRSGDGWSDEIPVAVLKSVRTFRLTALDASRSPLSGRSAPDTAAAWIELTLSAGDTAPVTGMTATTDAAAPQPQA